MTARKKIWFLISGVIVFLLFFLWLVRWGEKRNTVSHEQIIQMAKTVATTYRINTAIAEMQANSSGYYLTGDPGFKRKQQEAYLRLDSLMKVPQVPAADLTLRNQIDTLQLLLHERIATSDSMIYLHDHQVNEQDDEFFTRAFLLAETYGAYYSKVFESESNILKTKIRQNYLIIRNTLLILLTSGMAALAILVAVFIRINKILRKRKKAAEKQLQAGEDKYRKLIEDARVVLYTMNAEGIFTFINGRAKTLLGYTADELLGKHYSLLVPPDYLPLLQDTYKQQLEFKLPECELEFPILNKNGTLKWVEQMSALIFNENNQFREFQCIIKDIDEQKQLQLDMKEVEDNKRQYQLLLQALMDHSPSLIFVKDIHSKYLVINKKFESIFGLVGKDIIGKDDNVFNPPESARRFHADDEWVVAHKRQKKTIQILNTPHGPRSYMVTKFPLLTAAGEVGGVCGIAMDISDQIQKEQELEQAWKKAEEAEKAQEHFLAHVSHEIRTPLNGILGMTNLLKDSTLTAEQSEFVKIIMTSSETLLYLINDLLDTAKIKAGKLALEQIRFHPANIISKTLSGLQFRANEKELRLTSSISPKVPHVLIGDPYRLTQILLNLLVNAIKFTSEGTVSLKTSVKEKTKDEIWIRFEVEDTGIGIPADKIDTLFKEFSQVSLDTSRKYGGTGLGLSITEKLVKLQRGYVEVKSEVGKGSCFTIVIPYAYEDGTKSRVASGSTVREMDVSLKGITVLSAEDNEINQKIVGKILQKAGAKVLFAYNGKEAVDSVRNNPIDLVLMDLMMPEMDGFMATEKIRKELNSTVPVIALTGAILEAEQEKCLKTGMTACLAKPFSASELLKLIDELAPKK